MRENSSQEHHHYSSSAVFQTPGGPDNYVLDSAPWHHHLLVFTACIMGESMLYPHLLGKSRNWAHMTISVQCNAMHSIRSTEYGVRCMVSIQLQCTECSIPCRRGTSQSAHPNRPRNEAATESGACKVGPSPLNQTGPLAEEAKPGLATP